MTAQPDPLQMPAHIIHDGIHRLLELIAVGYDLDRRDPAIARALVDASAAIAGHVDFTMKALAETYGTHE